MIPLADFLTIVAIAALGAGLVCAAALLVLRLSRGASLTLRLIVLVTATVLSVVAGTVAIAVQMYISEHDLAVLIWVIAVSALLSLVVAWVIGRRLRRSTPCCATGPAPSARGRWCRPLRWRDANWPSWPPSSPRPRNGWPRRATRWRCSTGRGAS